MNLNQIDAYRAEATITLTEDEIFWIWLSMRPYIEEVRDSERPQLADKLTAIRKELANVHDDLQRACNEHDINVYVAARAARQARAKADLEAAIQGY
jgi:hypothetical protein